MKTISKRFLKASLAMLLVVVMLFGSTISGFAAVIENAETKANVDVAGTSATTRYIYVGISNNYQTYKDNNNYGFNFWGGSNGGVKSGTYLTTYTWDGRKYYMYRVSVSDDNNKAQFKGNNNWWDPGDGFSVTLNGTTNNAIFFSHQNDGWQGQFQQNYQETSTGKLTASSTSVSTNTDVTLTPSLSSNATYNQVKSTTYTVNKTGASVSGNTFRATSAGTYTVTATITYNPKYFTGITKTTTATTTITVTESKYSYNISAGANGTVEPSGSGSVNQGSSVDIEAKPNTGYSFDKWTVTNGSVGNTEAASTTFTPTDNNATATASFKANTYTVTLNKQNGTGGSSSVTATYNAAMPAITVPTRTGYTFGGYYTATNGGGTQYYKADGTSARNWDKTSDTTLYAKWTINKYTLSVTQNGGTGTVTLGGTTGTSKTVDYNTSVAVSITPPSGYKISSISGAITSSECNSYSGSVKVTGDMTINVTYAVAGSCTPQIDKSTMSLKIGETATRTATPNSYCDGSSFTYTSNNPSVADVNSSTGEVTAYAPGTATITVTCDEDNTTPATYTVEVATPTITISNATMNVNGEHTIDPTVTNANSYTVTYTENSSAFSISNGVIYAVTPTEATNVTATLKVGTWTTTMTFTVTVEAPTVTLKPEEVKLLTGQTMGTAYVTSASYGNPTVTITSGNTSVATISGGKATAVAPGSSTITATFTYNNSYKPTATATVLVKAPKITADPTSVALEFGEGATDSVKTTTVTLDPNTEDGNGTGDTITVTSDNASVATATVSGTTLTINATGVGSTTVKATFHGTTVEIPVTVTKYDPYAYIYVTDSFNWGTMYIYGWNGSSDVVIPKETSMIYIGKNGDGNNIFAYRILKTDLPEKAIFKKGTDWGYQSTDTVLTDAAVQSYYFDSNTWEMKSWNIDLVRPTVSVADVVVPVGGTETATATVTNGGKVLWKSQGTSIATIADVDTQTSTVTGVTPGETTITARAFVDTANSSIKALPTNYKTQTSCWPYISTEATATVTVGSVDYTVAVNAEVGGTASITVGGVDKGASASIAHGTEYTVTATANDGYRFLGWYNGETEVSTEASYTTTAKAAVTYTAKFVKTYKVSVLIGNGIESIRFNNVTNNVSFEDITVDAGADITVYATPAPGYKFKDWTVEGATVADNTAVNLTITNIQSDVILTANALPVYTASATATTRYISAGGSVTVNGQDSPIQLENGETATFKATPTRTFKFVGWFRDPNFTQLVSPDATYEENMTVNGISLYALFVKDMVLYDTDTSTVVNLTYDYLADTYSANTTAIGNNFKVSENVQGYNAIGADKVDVLNGNIVGATIGGNAQKYILTPDLENYDPTKGISYVIEPAGDNKYTMNITLQEADKVEISVNGTKVADKAIGSTFTYEIPAPAGQYLSGATTEPAVDFDIVDGNIEFTVPDSNVNIVPTFANYSYVEISDTTGITATGLKTGYKAGETVSITLSPENAQTSIIGLVADPDAGVTIENNGGTWTVTIESMPADTTINLTPTIDAKFAMKSKQLVVGNFDTGVTSYGTVKMTIDGATLAEGGYADRAQTVKYTATANSDYTFVGFYADEARTKLLTTNATYEVVPTADTTIYALFARKHYISFNSWSTRTEMTYDVKTNAYTYESSTITSSTAFKVTNKLSETDNYHTFDGSQFSVDMSGSKGASVSWGSGNNNWYVKPSDGAIPPVTIYVAPTSDKSIQVYARAEKVGATVFLSSGRTNIGNATTTLTTEGLTTESKEVGHDGDSEKYQILKLTADQSISWETEIGGTNPEYTYIDKYIVYKIETGTWEIIDPVTLGNNKYSGSVFVDGDCYIYPVYFRTDAYREATGYKAIEMYFDASAIQNLKWGPFVSCYAWNTDKSEKYFGSWPGQLLIPTEDGKSFYTEMNVPPATAAKPAAGVTFCNYMFATCPTQHNDVFGVTGSNVQTYDYREPITLYEAGYDVITFVAKQSADGYHGNASDGSASVKTVSSSTTGIFDTYTFDYLYSRDGVTPMDFNGDAIENHVDLSTGAKADYYVISKGDVIYNSGNYSADSNYNGEWSVEWYIFDSNGTYKTKVLSTGLYHDHDDNERTVLLEALGLTKEQAAGKTVAISYEHSNNAPQGSGGHPSSHQLAYDGQWYGNMLDDTVTGQVKVGFQNTSDSPFEIDNDDTPNIADYGEAYLLDADGNGHQTLEIEIEYGVADIKAVVKDGYHFVGWYTQKADGSYVEVSKSLVDDPYINMNETYYAIFRPIAEGEVVINHSTYINDDPAIPSHGGVAEMSIIVTDNNTGVEYKSTPSTSRSTVSFPGVEDGKSYTIQIVTTPLMNGQFFAWYTDSTKADGTKTYEEVFTSSDVVGKTTQVEATFEYEYTADSQKVINIYSDVRRVTNKANLIYKYKNRYGATRTYTVKDIALTDDECKGYEGNGYIEYCPTFKTELTFENSSGQEKILYADPEKVQEVIDAQKALGFECVDTYNMITAYAPKQDVTEVFNGIVNWTVATQYLTTSSSEVILTANPADPLYTINYEMAGQTGSKTDFYDELIEIDAPMYYNGQKFSYWYEEATNEILCYTTYYNYRIVENKTIKAVYGADTSQRWTPSINSVTYTREFGDNGDYIYTDYLLAYNSAEGKELNEVKTSENIEYGLLLVRDSSYYITDSDNVTYPDANNETINNYLKQVAKLGTSAAFEVEKTTYNCYCYDITAENLTNFNRCDYFRTYDNNKIVGGSHYYREYAFTAVAYIIVDGTVYLSNPKSVNFFDLGNTEPTTNN